jgi:protease-4
VQVPAVVGQLVGDPASGVGLGLADALGSVEYVAREVIKAETIVDYTPRENIAERVVRRFGAASAEALWGAATAPRVTPVR